MRHSVPKSQWQKNRAINKAYLQCGRWSVVGGRWLNDRNLVSGRLLFWSVVGFFTAIGRWSVVFQIGGRWFLWSVVGYFLGKWSVVPGWWSVVGVTVVGGFVLCPMEGRGRSSFKAKATRHVCPCFKS